ICCRMMEYTLQLEDTMNFTSVRTVRVLRPLRAINRVPNMRILVMLLLDTLPMLGNVLMLCSFVFFIFGVVAVQLWEGTLRQRCFLDPNVFNITGDIVQLHNSNLSRGEEDLAICSLPMDSGEFHCSDRSIITPFTVENITCSLNFESGINVNCTPMCIDWNQYMNTCKAGDSNPSLGSINFDNIMYAWVAIFQVISLEGWVDIMYYLMDGYSFYSFIYFILLIVIGSFFMINLCLVVIATQFSETKQREQRLMEEQRLRFKSNDSTLASYSPPGNCYEEMLKYISHLYRKNKRKIKRVCFKILKRSGMGSLKREVPVRSVRKKKKSIHLHHHHHHHHHHYHIADTIDRTEGLIRTLERRDRGLAITSDACPHTPQNFTQILPQRLMLTDGSNELVEPVKTGLTVPIHTPSASTSLHSICGAVGIPQRTNSYRDRRPSAEVTVNDPGSVYFKPRGLDPCFQPEILSTKFCPEATSPTDILGKNNTLPRPQSFVTSELNCSCAEYEISNPEVFEPGVESDLDEKPPTSYRRFLCCCCDQRETKEKEKERFSFLRDFQEQTKRVVDSSYFNRGIMIAILINTLSMGIEHHSQPDGLTEVLEISNVIFTTLFALEMIAKIVAFGVAGYTKNLYNVFDALIVIISIWEIAAGTQNSGGGLSVLRTFRLLRVLKLVRFMPALQRQLVVLMKTMDNVATFMMLLTLFIFIFRLILFCFSYSHSILGMHLFGCDFCWVNQYGRTECDRKNFDSLLWAFVTVFQILTQEDWNIVLYNGMAATSPFASIYFITLMTIGNYVLFSLLVAILVEGFQAETSSDEDEEVELLTRGRCPLIKVSTSKGGIYFIFLARVFKHGFIPLDELSESENWSLPVITRTSATPLHTPTLANISQENSLEKSFLSAESRGSSTDSQTEKDANHNTPQSVKKHAILSRKPSTEVRLFAVMLGRKNHHFITKYFLQSCLSISSVIKFGGGSPLSRTGSWRLRKLRKIPTDQQSLVYSEIEEDMYSNASFENEYKEREEITKNSSTGFQDCSNKAIPSHNQNNNNSVLTNENTTNTNEKTEITSSKCPILPPSPPNWTYTRKEWSLYLFSPELKFRRAVQKITEHKVFDNTILLLIFGNCITIAMERPSLKEGDYVSAEREVLDCFNNIFTFVFLLELILKVIASGFYVGPKAYLKSGWNVLDFFLVSTSLIDFIMTLAYSSGSKLLGMLRVLKGKFYRCVGPDLRNVTNKSNCLANPNNNWIQSRYIHRPLGGDGELESSHVTMETVTYDDLVREQFHHLWQNIQYILRDINPPIIPHWTNYNEVRNSLTPPPHRTPHPAFSNSLSSFADNTKYYEEYGPARRALHDVCMNKYFEIGISIVIGINILTMAAEHYKQPKVLDQALKIANYFFTAVFILEAVLKLIALGFRRYFRDRWNQVDMLIVILSVVGIAVEALMTSGDERSLLINPTIIRVMRVLRIARVLKLLKVSKGIRSLLETVGNALPQVGNLGLLFLLLFFIFAALGVELFGTLSKLCGCDEAHPCNGLSRHASFSNFGIALLTLFRISTGDNWNGIMKDTIRQECDASDSCMVNCCSSSIISPIYFVLFVMTAQFVLVNVVVAVLMK
uniref:Ion transport domain-containing protein n=1 Tax=Ciona savignyi TaxID=51511 RepID=H2YFM4_CIOSA